MSCNEFNIRNCVAVSGGYLSGNDQVVVELVECMDHGSFCVLDFHNRTLMKVLMHKSSIPRDKCHNMKSFPTRLLEHIKKIRDDAVDSILMQHLSSKDPMGEPLTKLPQGCHRTEVFSEAAVPQIINMELNEMTMDDGQRIASRTIRVFSTPRKKTKLTVELTKDMLTWLHGALQHKWPEPDIPDMHDLITSNLPDGLKFKIVADKVLVKTKSSKRRRQMQFAIENMQTEDAVIDNMQTAKTYLASVDDAVESDES